MTSTAGGVETAGGTRPRVLVVEDEYLVAMFLEDVLGTLGFEVVEIAPDIRAATRAAEAGSFDVAILDVNLNGTMSNPVAAILARRNIPFVFATAYGAAGPHELFGAVPTVQKPFEAGELERALSGVMGRQAC